MKRRIWILVIAWFALAATSPTQTSAVASLTLGDVSPSHLVAAGATPTPMPGSLATAPPSDMSTQEQITGLQHDVDNLKNELSILLVVASIFALLILGGGVVGLLFSFGDQKRTKKSFALALTHDATMSERSEILFNRTLLAADLAAAGERAAQGRAETVHSTFLAESQKTVT